MEEIGMRKALSLLLIGTLAITLVACSNSETKETKVENEEPKQKVEEKEEHEENEPTQEELDEKLKKEASAADFEEVNSDEVPKDAKLFVEGEVGSMTDDGTTRTFTLYTQESEGGSGTYDIQTFASLPNVEQVQEGDIVKVYGGYYGKNEDTGMPIISATIVEKK